MVYAHIVANMAKAMLMNAMKAEKVDWDKVLYEVASLVLVTACAGRAGHVTRTVDTRKKRHFPGTLLIFV